MNTSFFIAKRLIRSESTERELSKPIVRIATIGIALGMVVMILAVSIVTGFQGEIREKVIGFGSHIQITNFGSDTRYQKPKLEINQDFYPSIDTVSGVKSINIFALKEGVIETPENIQGVIAKGVANDYDWDFLNSKMVQGSILTFSDSSVSNELLISKFLAGRLQLELGDKFPIYFQNARSSMSQRNFTVAGIYDTGLKELDEEFVFIDIRQIKRLNQWGINANLIFEGCENNRVKLSAVASGGDGSIRLNWNRDSLRGEGPHEFCLTGSDTIYAVASDRSSTIPDTAFFVFTAPDVDGSCQCPDNYALSNSGGSAKYYTGGFEVQLDSFDDLHKMDRIIYEHINYNLRTTTIRQHLPEIFNWLEMLDLNTAIIIGLMILISIMNMTSALLIMIMERTQMIGLLKAMGAGSWFIQKTFLIQAAYIISIGLVAGNIIGIGLGLLQQKFSVIKLDPDNYYVSEVPVLLDGSTILIINLVTLVICLAAMILPSLAVTQIRPTKAIRFD